MATEQSTEAPEGVRFQTDLEQQHLPGEFDEPALMINPRAKQPVLLAAAQARMQVIHEGLGAWLSTTETNADPHEVLRPFEHLAQEVVNLLEALRLAQRTEEVSHG